MTVAKLASQRLSSARERQNAALEVVSETVDRDVDAGAVHDLIAALLIKLYRSHVDPASLG